MPTPEPAISYKQVYDKRLDNFKIHKIMFLDEMTCYHATHNISCKKHVYMCFTILVARMMMPAVRSDN